MQKVWRTTLLLQALLGCRTSSTFERERKILATLNHPQLPRLYDTFEDAEHYYLVIDYFAGETLEQYLHTQQSSIDESQPDERIEDVLSLGLQLSNVLDYLHTRNPPIIFRDLKPSNIICQSQHSYALVDFGIARTFKPAQARDTIPFGSPGYAAPEQYGRAQTDGRADIYSLGAILHQMLSDCNPTDQPFHFAPLSFTDPTLKRLGSLIMSMVALQADKRPVTIGDIARELRAIQQERQATHTPIWTSRPGSLPPPTDMPLLQPIAPPGKPRQPRKTMKRRDVLVGGLLTGAAIGQVIKTCASITRSGNDALGTISWSPNGRYIAATYTNGYTGPVSHTIQFWDAESGTVIQTYDSGDPPGEEIWYPETLLWSPDSKYVVTTFQDFTNLQSPEFAWYVWVFNAPS